jgi:hypothetical protein
MCFPHGSRPNLVEGSLKLLVADIGSIARAERACHRNLNDIFLQFWGKINKSEQCGDAGRALHGTPEPEPQRSFGVLFLSSPRTSVAKATM